jgi:Flp pilus assembly protein TadD
LLDRGAVTGLRFLLLPALIALLAACGGDRSGTTATDVAAEPDDLPSGRSDYVGAAACAQCHADEYRDWQGSHHQLAMQEATPLSVLGDFDGASFEYAGRTSEFIRRDGSYRVITDGPDGELAKFEISHTFGVEPLQQYLIELPGGRLQALGIAWDSRPESQGGQGWFHLYPDQAVASDHPLHWTGRNQNWNHMCADCHSTGLIKGYDASTDSYESDWEEISVSCEACHGPGRAHVEWAESDHSTSSDAGLGVRFDERRGRTWLPDQESGTARLKVARQTRVEIDACGRCHSRASRLLDGQVHGGSLLDSHRPVLLDPGEFHADGQMLAEVFNWASFLQSRMAQAGVTCSDCHNPHSLKLHLPGNALCAQCHQPSRFDRPEHHHHALDGEGSQCVACHMPQVTFMQVDVRHDHAFRIPRPDLSMAYGVPNSCTDCHHDQSAQWAVERLADWYPAGPDRSRDFIDALHGAITGEPGVRARLAAVSTNPQQPAIVRASALRALIPWMRPEHLPVTLAALKDPDPLLRLVAIEALAGTDPALQLGTLPALLKDPVLAVRIEAASSLAGAAEPLLQSGHQAAFDAALKELLASLDFNSDRPEANVRLGNLHAQRGDFLTAEAAYSRALTLDSRLIEAYINLADLKRIQASESAVDAILRAGLQQVPDSAELHHALGLSLVRQRRTPEALAALEKAVELAPNNPHYNQVLAVALHDWGQPERARLLLTQALQHQPYHRELIRTLAIYKAHAGDLDTARALARRLVELEPDDPLARQLLASEDNSSPE